MDFLVDVPGYKEKGIKIDPNGSVGEAIELAGLLIVLPKKTKERRHTVS